MYWLGIDIGTGGTRALLVDEKGTCKAGFTAPHEDMRMEKPLWAEQRPEDWWQAAQKAIQGVLAEAKIKGSQVKGVGLSGQMHGLVLLDANNAVIRPALIWCDQRSQAQVDSINRIVGKDNVLTYTANPVLTGFTLPKLLWVRDNEPQSFARARKVLLPKDYIRFELTGEYATEVSDASGTSLFDVVMRRWSHQMLDRLNLDRSLLPRVYESTEVTGTISARAAELTGLAEGTPVVGGGGDQAASAVGNGIVEPGALSCTLGTSGVVFAHMDKAELRPRRPRPHLLPRGEGRLARHGRDAGRRPQPAVVPQPARPRHGLRRAHRRSGQLARRRAGAVLAAVSHGGTDAAPGLDGARRLDRPDGEAHPRRPDPRAARRRLLQPEGLPRSHRPHGRAGGRHPLVWRGALSSVFWRQLFADVFGKRVVTLASQEGSAYGAAILAQAGTGVYATVPEACRASIKEVDSVLPRPHESQLYRRGYEVYRALYPSLRPIYSLIESLR